MDIELENEVYHTRMMCECCHEDPSR